LTGVALIGATGSTPGHGVVMSAASDDDVAMLFGSIDGSGTGTREAVWWALDASGPLLTAVASVSEGAGRALLASDTGASS